MPQELKKQKFNLKDLFFYIPGLAILIFGIYTAYKEFPIFFLVTVVGWVTDGSPPPLLTNLYIRLVNGMGFILSLIPLVTGFFLIRKKFNVLIILGIIFSVYLMYSFTRSQIAFYNSATGLEIRNDYEGLLKEYTRKINETNESDYFEKRGDIYYALGRYSEASDDYKVWVSANPDLAIVYKPKLFTAYLKAGKIDPAVKEAQEYSENPISESQRDRAVELFGDVLYAAREYQKAYEVYTSSREIRTKNRYKDFAIVLKQAKALTRLGKIKEAETTFNEAFQIQKEQLEKDRSDPYDFPQTSATALADFYYYIGDIDKAQQLYIQAFNKDPDNPDENSGISLAIILLKKGSYEEAVGILDKVIERWDTNIWATKDSRELKIKILYDNGKTWEAAAEQRRYDEVLKKEPAQKTWYVRYDEAVMTSERIFSDYKEQLDFPKLD